MISDFSISTVKYETVKQQVINSAKYLNFSCVSAGEGTGQIQTQKKLRPSREQNTGKKKQALTSLIFAKKTVRGTHR